MSTLFEDERRGESDALLRTRNQAAARRLLFINNGEPFFPHFFRISARKKLLKGVGNLSKPTDCYIEPQNFVVVVAEKKVSVNISGDERHRLRTQPAPVLQKAFNAEMFDSEVIHGG